MKKTIQILILLMYTFSTYSQGSKAWELVVKDGVTSGYVAKDFYVKDTLWFGDGSYQVASSAGGAGTPFINKEAFAPVFLNTTKDSFLNDSVNFFYDTDDNELNVKNIVSDTGVFNNNVGIGTSTPQSILNIRSTAGGTAGNISQGLTFNDKVTGIHEAYNNLYYTLNGTGYYTMSGTYMLFGTTTTRPAMLTETPSFTNPVICPAFVDPNTGVGWSSADKLVLISGGEGKLETTTDDINIYDANSSTTLQNFTGLSLINNNSTNGNGIAIKAGNGTYDGILAYVNDDHSGNGHWTFGAWDSGTFGKSMNIYKDSVVVDGDLYVDGEQITPIDESRFVRFNDSSLTYTNVGTKIGSYNTVFGGGHLISTDLRFNLINGSGHCGGPTTAMYGSILNGTSNWNGSGLNMSYSIVNGAANLDNVYNVLFSYVNGINQYNKTGGGSAITNSLMNGSNNCPTANYNVSSALILGSYNYKLKTDVNDITNVLTIGDDNLSSVTDIANSLTIGVGIGEAATGSAKNLIAIGAKVANTATILDYVIALGDSSLYNSAIDHTKSIGIGANSGFETAYKAAAHIGIDAQANADSSITIGSDHYVNGIYLESPDTIYSKTNHKFDSNLIVNGNIVLINTVWDDLKFPSTLAKQGSSTKPDFDYTDLGLLFPADSGEAIYIIDQMPHAWKHGSMIEPHIHWIQSSTDTVDFRLKYRFYNIGDEVTAWTYVALEQAETIEYSSGDLHQYAEFGMIDMTGLTGSCMLDMVIYRIDEGGTGAVSGDVLFKEFDIHYQKDKIGSDNEIPTN